MAETIYTKDGNMTVILSDKDFTDLVYDYMGVDAESKVKEYIPLTNKAEHAVNTDLSSYESSLESNNACFNEILEITEMLKREMCNARVNKTVLFDNVLHIKQLINNQI